MYKFKQGVVQIAIPVTREQIEAAGVEVRGYTNGREWTDATIEITVQQSLLGVRLPHIKIMATVEGYRNILSRQVHDEKDMRAYQASLRGLAEMAIGKTEFAALMARVKKDIPCWTD